MLHVDVVLVRRNMRRTWAYVGWYKKVLLKANNYVYFKVIVVFAKAIKLFFLDMSF